ncbi:type I restriction enzyme, S subunit [Vibrio crassostreae]|uniref:restriction endonuclease subunit S n=1 Tax=Vibrio crassostreae TaxID=246167 RepID=UPI00148E2504|nr:restriction endonuclease subunit S [Vibrio crassostreae]NOH74403.1 restriction endonuclease subunit S [Vibrio crassostreae]CAK2471363.1 type I restriction enzyme, S subunit [Vibrio crassostreae]CAK2853289.1 type I restriction enzyme, S subunit [Vibrio crassostreae]CAK3448796.1 type I restriction enzyme, S subunit [Vibrio crassostreae]
MSWPTVELGSLGTVYAGGTPSRGNADYWGEGIKWLSIKDYQDFDYVSFTKEQITDEGLRNSSAKLFSKGNVIISIFATLGRVAILGENMATNQAIAAIDCHETIHNKYLMYALKAQLPEIERKAGGVAQKNINLSILKSLQIPLPPLETQKQIAEVLEKADQLRKDCQQMEQELNSLSQSVFIDMFGSKAPGYSEWPLHHIEELAESKKGSMRTGPFGSDLKHSEFVDEGIAVIGIDNAVKNEFAWGERRFITPEKYEKLKRYRVYPQDLIITIMGTTGRIAVIPNDIPLSISTKHLAVITLDKEKVLPEFLAIAIKTHPDLLHQILDSNKGAIMDGLNLGLIKALSLKLPPLDLQSEYLAVLKVIQEQVFESRSSLKQHNDLFNALMQKAFKGELNL